MAEYIIVGGELKHYGVKGMKWGQRNPNVQAAKQNYKSARKEFRKVTRRSIIADNMAINRKGIKKAQKIDAEQKKALTKQLDARIEYKKSKAKNQKQADKIEFKEYKKALGTIRGSRDDIERGGRATTIYNSMKAKKGKAYADKVEKQLEKTHVAKVAVSTAVTVGYAACQAYGAYKVIKGDD